MAVFKKQALIESSPAYDVFKREACRIDGLVQITAGELLGLKKPRGYYKAYEINSVVSYALEYNEDPIAAVERAKGRGEKLQWINARASVLSASEMPREQLIAVELGMVICFEGVASRIEADFNDNLKLVPVAA